MKGVKKGPTNRCFGGNNCPRNTEKEREEALKAALKEAAEKMARKRSEAAINDLLRLSKGL